MSLRSPRAAAAQPHHGLLDCSAPTELAALQPHRIGWKRWHTAQHAPTMARPEICTQFVELSILTVLHTSLLSIWVRHCDHLMSRHRDRNIHRTNPVACYRLPPCRPVTRSAMRSSICTYRTSRTRFDLLTSPSALSSAAPAPIDICHAWM